MKRFVVVALAACTGLINSMLAPNAKADDWSKKTEITFSNPVEIPGVHLAGWGILPAGTYVFRILDSQSDRHVVQILNKDETVVCATILAIPNHRLKWTDKTVITLSERPSGEPEALRSWFYPGTNRGEEFVYPRAKAVVLAKATNAPVLFTPVEMPSEVVDTIKSPTEPILLELRRAPIMAIMPAGDEVQVAQVVTPPPEQAEVAEAPPISNVASLPNTASSIPLLGIFGILALVGAVAFRAVSTRLK